MYDIYIYIQTRSHIYNRIQNGGHSVGTSAFPKKTCVATVPYFLPSQKNWQCCKRQKLDQGYSCFFGAGSVCPQNIEHKFQQTGVCVCAGTKITRHHMPLHSMVWLVCKQEFGRTPLLLSVSVAGIYEFLFGWTCSPWSIMILIGICLPWKSLRASSEKINYRSSTPCQFGIKCIKAIENLLHYSLNLLDQHGQLLRQGRQQNRIWFMVPTGT